MFAAGTEYLDTVIQPGMTGSMVAAAVLDLPELAKRVHHFTLDEYHLLGEIPERTELIEGVIIEKMPKSPVHIYITETLKELAAKIFGVGYYIREEKPLSITALDSEPEPDIAVIYGDRRDYLERHPDTAVLVIEVAVTSLALDRIKMRGYALAGVREYWIIRADTRSAEVYRIPKGEGYAESHVVPPEGSLDVNGGKISLQSIFPKLD
jgi:Uma2 family endonuclease